MFPVQQGPFCYTNAARKLSLGQSCLSADRGNIDFWNFNFVDKRIRPLPL